MKVSSLRLTALFLTSATAIVHGHAAPAPVSSPTTAANIAWTTIQPALSFFATAPQSIPTNWNTIKAASVVFSDGVKTVIDEATDALQRDQEAYSWMAVKSASTTFTKGVKNVLHHASNALELNQEAYSMNAVKSASIVFTREMKTVLENTATALQTNHKAYSWNAVKTASKIFTEGVKTVIKDTAFTMRSNNNLHSEMMSAAVPNLTATWFNDFYPLKVRTFVTTWLQTFELRAVRNLDFWKFVSNSTQQQPELAIGSDPAPATHSEMTAAVSNNLTTWFNDFYPQHDRTFVTTWVQTFDLQTVRNLDSWNFVSNSTQPQSEPAIGSHPAPANVSNVSSEVPMSMSTQPQSEHSIGNNATVCTASMSNEASMTIELSWSNGDGESLPSTLDNETEAVWWERLLYSMATVPSYVDGVEVVPDTTDILQSFLCSPIKLYFFAALFVLTQAMVIYMGTLGEDPCPFIYVIGSHPAMVIMFLNLQFQAAEQCTILLDPTLILVPCFACAIMIIVCFLTAKLLALRNYLRKRRDTRK